jgi:hypothetical protein
MPFNKVDLPAPFGPTIARRLPVVTERQVVETDHRVRQATGPADHRIAQSTAAQSGTMRQAAAASRWASDRRNPETCGKNAKRLKCDMADPADVLLYCNALAMSSL